MFLFGFHVIAVGMVMAGTWFVAYGAGRREGERRARRMLEKSGAAA